MSETELMPMGHSGQLEQYGDASGPIALASMSQQSFEARLKALKLAGERVRQIQRELLVEGEDYGVIPGTQKPTLLKPGAEKMCQAYRMVPTFVEETFVGDGETAPDLRVRVKCFLHLGSSEGPIVGEGGGAANSWEKRYRYRGGQRACPKCGVEGTVKRSKFEKDGDKGWYCHSKSGGCGAEFRSDDKGILEQQISQVENADPYDAENTLVKIAMKRAQIDGVLRATATSGLFTQDVEDMQHQQQRRQAAPQSQTGTTAPATTTDGAPPAKNGTTTAAAAAPNQDGSGIVKAVTSAVDKTDTTTGKPGRVTMEDGRTGTTFDKKLLESAKDAMEKKTLVVPKFEEVPSKKPGGKPFVNIVGLEPVRTNEPELPIEDTEPVGQPESILVVRKSTQEGSAVHIIQSSARQYLTSDQTIIDFAKEAAKLKVKVIITFTAQKTASNKAYNLLTKIEEVPQDGSSNTVSEIEAAAEAASQTA